MNDHFISQHRAGRAAYEEAQKQISELQKSIETKSSVVKTIQNDLERHKLEASESHKIEQVSSQIAFLVLTYVVICDLIIEPFSTWQACIKEQERLIPLEQTARVKVADLLSTMESEKNHGSVLKTVLQAKESNHIHGVYGRMGDLGAIDGEHLTCARTYAKLKYD